MTEYRVRWEIDIEADSPQEAAEKALLIQRRHNSIATVFDVTPHGGAAADTVTIDLTPDHA